MIDDFIEIPTVNITPIGTYQDVVNGQNVTVTVYPKVDPRPKKMRGLKVVEISGIFPPRVTHASRSIEQSMLYSD
jgi:hypothetical protein